MSLLDFDFGLGHIAVLLISGSLIALALAYFSPPPSGDA